MTMVTMLIVLTLTVTAQCHDYVMTREQLTHEVEELEENGRDLADQVDALKRQNEGLEQRDLFLSSRVENLTRENEKLAEIVERLDRLSGRGFGAGSLYTTSGSGANRLCLSPDPVFDNTRYDRRVSTGSLYGAQYWINDQHANDALCSLCRTPYAATFMVPGTNECPPGTVLQYHGHLSSGQDNHPAQSEYICLDAQAEARTGSSSSNGPSAWLEYTVTVCGTLPCPPYVADKVVTCAVCSL